jgi:hypothetical protein
MRKKKIVNIWITIFVVETNTLSNGNLLLYFLGKKNKKNENHHHWQQEVEMTKIKVCFFNPIFKPFNQNKYGIRG